MALIVFALIVLVVVFGGIIFGIYKIATREINHSLKLAQLKEEIERQGIDASGSDRYDMANYFYNANNDISFLKDQFEAALYIAEKDEIPFYMMQVAEMYETGQGTEKDTAKALEFYKKALTKGARGFKLQLDLKVLKQIEEKISELAKQ